MSQSAAARVAEEVALPHAGTYVFDKSHTELGLVARHMVSKVRGRFTEFDGQVVIGETPYRPIATTWTLSVVARPRPKGSNVSPRHPPPCPS